MIRDVVKPFLFLSLLTSNSYAGVIDDINAQLESYAEVNGTFDEGEIEIVSRKCRPQDLPPQMRDGKYRHFLTYASGTANSYYDSDNGRFYVSAPYSCRIRTRIVSGCGGVETNRDHDNVTSEVTIEASVGFDGFVSVISSDLGGHQNCGKSVERITVQRLDGTKIQL